MLNKKNVLLVFTVFSTIFIYSQEENNWKKVYANFGESRAFSISYYEIENEQEIYRGMDSFDEDSILVEKKRISKDGETGTTKLYIDGILQKSINCVPNFGCTIVTFFISGEIQGIINVDANELNHGLRILYDIYGNPLRYSFYNHGELIIEKEY